MLVTDRLVAQIAQIGRERAPEEACGLIFAGGKLVELKNATELDPTCNYYLGALPSILRQLREQGVTDQMFEGKYLVWHTHPGGLVGPSPDDMAYKVEGVEYMVVTPIGSNYVVARF